MTGMEAKKEYLTSKELSERQGYPSTHSLYKWRRKGDGPPYVRQRGRIFYRLKDVVAWEEGNVVYPTPLTLA